ncbi:hypothetical protein EAY73_23815, partial [Vibrio anguillarum]|nr:hypothetical protein [Vibrio anguillarum]
LSSSLRQVSNNDLVFLYVARNSKGTITSLSDLSLHNNIKKFIKEYDLRDEDGRTMKLNVSRFRKTFINGIYELSGESLLIA